MLGDLGKLIVAKGFKKLPKSKSKSKKSPDLVTLVVGKKVRLSSFYAFFTTVVVSVTRLSNL